MEGLVRANVPYVQLANIRTLNNKQPCKDDMYEEIIYKKGRVVVCDTLTNK